MQESFSGGELAPSLHARVDLAKYSVGLKTCRNFFVQAHGGVSNRSGTRMITALDRRLIFECIYVPGSNAPSNATSPVGALSTVSIPYGEGEGYSWGTDTEIRSHITLHDGPADDDTDIIYWEGDKFIFKIQDLEFTVTIAPTNVDNTVSRLSNTLRNGISSGVFNELYYANSYQSSGRVITITKKDAAEGADRVPGRLIPFSFNTEQTYVLVFSDLVLQIIKDGGAVVDSDGDLVIIPTPYKYDQLENLQVTQSADVMTICHRDFPPMELSRSSHTSWSLSEIVFGSALTQVVGVSVSGQNYDGADPWMWHSYVVTAVEPITGAESPVSSAASLTNNHLGNGVTNTVAWTAHSSGIIETYNVYKKEGGIYGFIGRATSNSFIDDNIRPDISITPPVVRAVFDGAGKYPEVVSYYQQRLIFGQSTNEPQTLWMSQAGAYKNFNTSVPLRADDAITLTIAAREVNELRHIVGLDSLLLLTSGGEWLLSAAGDGAIQPGSVHVKPQGYRGSSNMPPIAIGNTVIYVQSKGAIIRDLAYSLESDSYTGNDLTVLSNHLFAGKTVKSWAYAQAPWSLVWVVLSDGSLVTLTYMREHEVWGWARHDSTNGLFESVCTVTEGSEDAVYFLVKRVIDGNICRYVERLESRVVNELSQSFFVDSGLSYDGTHTGKVIVGIGLPDGSTLTGISYGTGIELGFINYEDGYASVSTIIDGTENPRVLRLYAPTGEVLQVKITGTHSTNGIVTGTVVSSIVADVFQDFGLDTSSYPGVVIDVTKAFGNSGTTNVDRGRWSLSAVSLSGLSHLEGEEVSLFGGDGEVLARQTVSGGSVSLPNSASGGYEKVSAGLPIEADFETLPINVSNRNVQGKAKSIGKTTFRVENTLGGKAGPNLDDLTEFKTPVYSAYDTASEWVTGDIAIVGSPKWTQFGSISFRQDDPLPVTILAVIPEVEFGK